MQNNADKSSIVLTDERKRKMYDFEFTKEFQEAVQARYDAVWDVDYVDGLTLYSLSADLEGVYESVVREWVDYGRK